MIRECNASLSRLDCEASSPHHRPPPPFFRQQEGKLSLPQVIKIAADVSRGMDYLHQRKIIHRDLKAANLLMDEHNIVKIADFGVARIIETTGHMTAETGTYRRVPGSAL